ncbi:MAG: amino acid ABC transporter substrate-binding protein [bacterium]|nr:amino acid ABC transporter substrate-binding protein [bacterium]
MKYQLLFSVLLIVGVCVFSLPTSAQELTIACEANLPPFSYKEDGEVKGVVIEILHALLQKVGRTDEIRLYPWARLYNVGLEDDNMLICAITHTAERDALFQWCGEIVVSPLVLFALTSRDDIEEMSDVEALKQYEIGTLRNAQREQYLIKKGLVVGEHLAPVKSYRQNYLKL